MNLEEHVLGIALYGVKRDLTEAVYIMSVEEREAMIKACARFTDIANRINKTTKELLNGLGE